MFPLNVFIFFFSSSPYNPSDFSHLYHKYKSWSVKQKVNTIFSKIKGSEKFNALFKK